MSKVLICGGNGFIGSALGTYLEKRGDEVIRVDLPQYDLRDRATAEFIFTDNYFDEVYQLAADMGGIGYINTDPLSLMINNIRINTNILESAIKHGVKRYFFGSSVCVYPDTSEELNEDVLLKPDNGYGWEKLFTEKLLEEAKNKTSIRIGRFETTYGVGNQFSGGKEKVIGALCRKIAMTKTKAVEVWGDGSAIRSFIYIDDLVKAIDLVMHSEEDRPVNIGVDERVSIKVLAEKLINISRKDLVIKYIDGHTGVSDRNFSKDRLKALGFMPDVTLDEGLEKTFNWVNKQIWKR